MVFSTTAFLFFFLPIVLMMYYIVIRGRLGRNILLTVVSLLFYAWGEPWFVLVMLLSILLNWWFGLQIDKNKQNKRRAKGWLAAICALDVGMLGVFKYSAFLTRNVNAAFSLKLPVPEIMLPIGISFFTFQAISYVVDVYRGKGEAQKHFLNVCLYISFFPQLIAGPIVRYETVALELKGRRETADDFCLGVRRFLAGLCKKAILANSLALIVDGVFALKGESLSLGLAWMGAAAYLIQVYYDFSGYSDMAIGLGLMFGFHFLENFNFPFLSKSVTEFWRRWHISLGSWFRDYVFFPLGGSRVKRKTRLLLNMFVVWSLTGLWHGAEWTYAIWGVGFFVAQAVERFTGLGKWMEKHAVGHLYAMLIVVVITVLIRSESIAFAGQFYQTMFGLNSPALWNPLATLYVREYGLMFAASVVISLPVGGFLQRALRVPEGVMQVLRVAGLALASVVAVSYVVTGGYNPFIYFNF